jgi:hypothetical protein
MRDGRNAPEWVADFLRKQWPESIGIGGRLRPESPAGIERNMQVIHQNEYSLFPTWLFRFGNVRGSTMF